MRDFRDAKSMAQTLRELLKAKSVSLTHSESLELMAKILGVQDWNVLSATIEAAVVKRNKAASTPLLSGGSDQEVLVAAKILDGYVGFFQLSDRAIYKVTRDGGHLLTQVTGQSAVPFYAQSNTEFFAKDLDAKINFLVGENGQALSLVHYQGGKSYPMKRIEAAKARRIETDVANRVQNQLPNPGSEAALRRFIEGLTSGKPDYHELGSDLAKATREQLSYLHTNHRELGPVETLRFLGVGREGEDVYTVRHENGASHWRIAMDSKGLIAMAWVTPGP